MANTTKITVAQKFDMVVKFLNENGADSVLVDFILDRKEKAQKKSSTFTKKPSKITEEIKNEVLALIGEKTYAKELANILDISPQAVAPRTKALVQEGLITRDKDKDGLFFSRVNAETAVVSD